MPDPGTPGARGGLAATDPAGPAAAAFQAADRMWLALGLHFRRRAEWYLVPLLYPGLVAVVYADIFWSGKVGIGWDLIESYWPDLAFIANEFSRGNFPLWNPYERGGYPAHADPQPALFYPVQWLLAAWGAWRGEASWYLIQGKELLHGAIVGATMHAFLRTRRLPWQAALVGGLIAVLGGPWSVNKSHNYIQAVAWTPLVWIATDALLARPALTRACALAAALYLPASAGSPPGYFYVLLAAGAYGLFRALPWIALRVRGWRPWVRSADAAAREARRALGRLALALGVAVILGLATQLLLMWPTREILALSPRAVRAADFALGGQCAVDPVLRSLLLPSGGWYGSSLGFVAMIACASALVLGPGRDRGAPVFFVVAGGLFTAMAFGAETPILRWLAGHVPGFNLFRISCRYLLLFELCAGAAAAYGVATLMDARVRQARRWPVVAALSLALVAILIWLLRRDPAVAADAGAPWRPALVAGASAAIAVAIACLRHRAAMKAVLLLPVLLCLDLTGLYAKAPGYHPRPDNLEDRAKVAHLPGLDRYRVYDEFLLEQRAGSRLGLREFRGYTSGDPLVRADYGAAVAAAIKGPLQLLAEYNVRYIFHGPHTIKGWDKKLLPGAPDAVAPKWFRKLAPVIYEAAHPAPMAAWYGGLRAAPEAGVLAALGGVREPSGARRVAMVAREELARTGIEQAAAPLLRADGPALRPGVAGTITHFSTEEVAFDVDAPAPGVAVLNEAHLPAWKVFVDGRQARAFKVDLFLRGVMLPAGRHHVRWVYRPDDWPWLAGLWCAGMTAFLAAAIWSLRRRDTLSRFMAAPVPADRSSHGGT